VQSAPLLGSAPDRAQLFGTCFFHKSPFDTNHAFLQRHPLASAWNTTAPDPQLDTPVAPLAQSMC
jgi:hypothetical protein